MLFTIYSNSFLEKKWIKNRLLFFSYFTKLGYNFLKKFKKKKKFRKKIFLVKTVFREIQV